MTTETTDSDDTISVAVAAYKGERYLREQLDSIARQTLLPCEVVITDDSPTGETRAIADQFAQIAPFPVRIFANPERLGYVDNFLRAASLCTGRWIAFCDQDDVWMPEKLAHCIRTLTESGALLAVHASRVVDSDLNPAEGREPIIERSEILEPLAVDPWWCPPGFAMVFAGDLLRRFDAAARPNSQIADGQLPHDHWVYFLAQALGRIALIETPLAFYRRHTANVTADLPPTGLKHAASASASAGSEHYRSVAGLATSYAAFWRQQALNFGDDTPEIVFGKQTFPAAEIRRRCADAVTFYDDVARRLLNRAALYDPGLGGASRVGALSRQIAAGAYGSRRGGGLGARSLAKDMFIVARALLGARPSGGSTASS